MLRGVGPSHCQSIRSACVAFGAGGGFAFVVDERWYVVSRLGDAIGWHLWQFDLPWVSEWELKLGVRSLQCTGVASGCQLAARGLEWAEWELARQLWFA